MEARIMANFSTLPQQFTINGVLSTDDSVLGNMEKIAASCSSWITYDIHAGKWSVIINRAGSSIKAFDDSNIIGPINVSSTGLTDLYNSVKVTYPRVDINDEIDWVRVDLPQADRNYLEPDQTLDMELFMTNDPVQAELVGFLELKQNRVDKLVTFATDYTAIDLNAGDLIDITNSTWGWTNKVFRILSMREIDGDSGEIRIEITGLEYDASVYENDLNRYSRSSNDGILSIGAIGVPATPTINVTNRDARPNVVLNGTTPTGVITGLEFWLSQTSSSTGFQLVGIERPQSATTFPPSTAVSVDVDNINAGNIWVKTRGFNADVDGPFSNVALTNYAPVQVTNAVNPDTEVTDINGGLLTAAALTTLLTSLDGLYSNNASGGGSLFDKIFGIFDTVTGVDILQDIPNIANTSSESLTALVAGGNTLSGATFPDVIFNAGPNVTIQGDSVNNIITIDAIGGGGGVANVGNLVIGNAELSFGNNITFVTGGTDPYFSSQITIQANTAANVVGFSALPGGATDGYILQEWQELSGGPFDGTLPFTIITGNAAVAVSNTGIFIDSNFNWLASGNPGDDPLKAIRLWLNINGSNVQETGDSSRSSDAYENQIVNMYYDGAVSQGDTVQIIYGVYSEVATGVRIDTKVWQPPFEA